MKRTIIGTGVMTWTSRERRSDRYGTIMLMHNVGNADGSDANFNQSKLMPNLGKEGELVIEILETRESSHIGDLFRGFVPSTPKKGEVIKIGSGTLFKNDVSIGLRPRTNREHDWLDPEQLYKCHEQTVNVFFVTK